MGVLCCVGWVTVEWESQVLEDEWQLCIRPVLCRMSDSCVDTSRWDKWQL